MEDEENKCTNFRKQITDENYFYDKLSTIHSTPKIYVNQDMYNLILKSKTSDNKFDCIDKTRNDLSNRDIVNVQDEQFLNKVRTNLIQDSSEYYDVKKFPDKFEIKKELVDIRKTAEAAEAAKAAAAAEAAKAGGKCSQTRRGKRSRKTKKRKQKKTKQSCRRRFNK